MSLFVKDAPTKQDIGQAEKFNSTVFIPSAFKFLSAHNGLRPRSSHMLVGTTGCGKSRLLQSIIAEVSQTQKCLVWLSEDDTAQYVNSMDRNVKISYRPENLKFINERDLPDKVFDTQARFFSFFKDSIVEANADAVFIDNVTTSYFYADEVGTRGQGLAAKFIQKVAPLLDVVMVYVTHTMSKVKDNQKDFISIEDVRGNRRIANESEYAYVLQKVIAGGTQYVLLRTSKHRHHDVKEKVYLLDYRYGAYVGDIEIPFSEVKKLFKSRDVL